MQYLGASFEGSGGLSLELSADDGLHYYPAVCGVPLSSFVSGNRIKWRVKQLDSDAALTSVTITYKDSAGTYAGFGVPELSGARLRSEIKIKNETKLTLYNYQLKLILGRGEKKDGVDILLKNAAVDFSDIRFTLPDQQTLIPYYIEKITTDKENTRAVAWLKIPELPAEGISAYLYYGNSAAVSLSDPQKVFDFYDDFISAKEVEQKWEFKIDPKGSMIVKDSQLTLDAAEIMAKDFIYGDGIVEVSVLPKTGVEESIGVRVKGISGYENPNWSAYSSAYKGAEHCITVDDIIKINDDKAQPALTQNNYNFRITLSPKGINFARFNPQAGKVEAEVNYQAENNLKSGGHLCLKSAGDGFGHNAIVFSEVRARKYANPQPRVSAQGKEEAVQLPAFSNFSLSPKGELILINLSQGGTYIANPISPPFAARIIKGNVLPAQAGTSLDLSADAGVTYKNNAQNDTYYYASKKDFIAGSNIIARLKISPSKDKKTVPYLESFSIDYNPGMIIVTRPNGGESWPAGLSSKISWSALGYEANYPFKLEYSTDKGNTYSLISSSIPNSGAYSWAIPEDLQSDKCLIRVCDSFDNTINDISDKPFSIQATEEPKKEKIGQEVIEEEAINLKEAGKKRPGTQLYEMLIKLGDNRASRPEEDKRASYKNGDIVLILPAGHQWSDAEKTSFLIIQAYLTQKEAAALMAPGENISVDKKGKTVIQRVAKRKYKLNFTKQGVAARASASKPLVNAAALEEKR